MTGTWQGRRYVALGSSFAAGPGLSPMAADRPKAARQSAVNYAHLTAGELGMTLHDVTSSGATTHDILRDHQHGQEPQLTAVDAATDLVTVTIGGDDVGYVQTLFALSAPRWIRRLPVLGRRVADLLSGLDTRFAGLATDLSAVVAGIRDRAPAARIVLVDYLTVLPGDYASALPLSHDDFGLVSSIADRLVATTAEVASSTGVALLDVAKTSRDHHAWSPEPWTSGFLAPWPWRQTVGCHPTVAGMRAVADRLRVHLLATGAPPPAAPPRP
jgi:lysophospholipase L1-like esterase